MSRMKRLQISIEPGLDAAVGRRAEEEGVSKAEVIRRCVREEIQPLPRIEEDPFFKMCGTVDGSPDSSVTINEVVYGLNRDHP